jgi:hypothetical protein
VRYLLLALLSLTATAGTINVSFEPPAYVDGPIGGQQGWSSAPYFDTEVTSADAYEGAQSLRISNAVTSGGFGNQTFTPQLAVPAGESSVAGALNTFEASWYFKSVTGALQDGLGISVSADNGSGARMTWLRMQDDAVNGMNLQFVDFSGSPENFVYQELATNLDRSVWHRVDMIVYFREGPGQRSRADFARRPTAGERDDVGRLQPVLQVAGRQRRTSAAGEFAPLPRRRTAAPSLAGEGFYIDDVTIESLDTPEPASFGLLDSEIIGLLLRRIPRS